jgi:hypothetical protein
MIAYGEQLCVGTRDGLYMGDETGTFYNVLPELSHQKHEDNCRDLTIHHNGIVVPHVGGLYWYRSNGLDAQVDVISPPPPGRNNPISGYPLAVRSIGDTLLAAYWTGSASFLLAGHSQPSGWVWHPLNRIPVPWRVNRLHVDGITVSSGGVYALPNRLWVLTSGSPNPNILNTLYACEIPPQYGNPLVPTPAFSANYVGSAVIELGSVDFGAPSTPKLFRSVEVWAENLTWPARVGNFYYDVDHSGSWTLLGQAITSPKQTLYFPAGEGTFTTGQSIELRLESFTASAAFTPIYRTILIRGALMPRSVDEITAVVRIADNMSDRQGQPMRSAATQIKELRDLANVTVTTQPIQLIDLTGATQWVKLIPPIGEMDVYQQGSDYPELAATIRMAVLSYTS